MGEPLETWLAIRTVKLTFGAAKTNLADDGDSGSAVF